MKQKQHKGITLIALVITIVVMLILTSVTINMTVNGGLFSYASEANFKAELTQAKEEFDLFKLEKMLENVNFNEESLNIGQNTIDYNTKPEGATGKVETVFAGTSEKHKKNIEVIKGQMYYKTTKANQIKWLQDIGITPNPYDIVDGVLLSSNNNLLLMDNTGTLRLPESVEEIGSGAFKNLEGLRTILIPSTVKKIGANAFSGNTTLENVYISEGVEEIGEFCFNGCTSLKHIEIPNSVTLLGSTCFGSCTSLEEITIPGTIKEIPFRMLSKCTNIENINIEEGVEKISGNAFEQCSKVEEIEIPESITSINGNAFQRDNKLTNIIINPNNTTYSFKNGILLSKNGKDMYFALPYLTELNIPESVINIKSGALWSLKNIKVINIPKNIETISDTFNANVKEIKVDSQNNNFTSINGNLYDKDVERLIKYCSNDSIVNLPSTLTCIAIRAFEGQGNVTEINLPESMQTLQSYCFYGSKIQNIYIPQNVTNINPLAFHLVDVNVSISADNETYSVKDDIYILSKDGSVLYLVSKNQKNYNIPSSVTRIGTSAFYSKTLMESIILPSNIKEIDGGAFDHSTNLKKVEIQNNIEKIDTAAFSRCESLKEIIIHKQEGDISGAPWGAPYGLRAVQWDKSE